jgi:hypothetical protein
VTGAPALLAKEYPELASNISAALGRLERVVPPSLEGLKALDTKGAVTCGEVSMRFGAGGGLTSLKRCAGGGQAVEQPVLTYPIGPCRSSSRIGPVPAAQWGGARPRRGGLEWAGGEEQPLGQFVYETYTSADFDTFLRDMGSRIGDDGIWPHHTAGRYSNFTRNTSDLTWCAMPDTIWSDLARAAH